MLESHLTLSNTDLDALVNRSGVLFIYAATVIRYVSNKDFARGQTRLQEVLNIHAVSSDGSTRDIDALYTAILDIAYDDHDLTRLDRVEMLFILHTVICAGEPLSKRVMKSLLSLKNEERVQAALLPLLSVLQISETSGVVTTLHESFRDYLLEKERSGRFYCDAAQHNETLAKYCLHHINQLIPFNICSLESSYLFDRDVDGLENKIRETISEEVFYGCCYWSIHIIAAKVSESLAGLIFKFLSERLLLWMEIMNLKNVFARGAQILHEMERYSQNSTLLGEETKNLLQDGWIFMTTCSSSPVLFSTPHIYISTLLFWPADSPIGKYYSLDISSIVSPNSTATAPGVRRVTPTIKIRTGQDTKHVAYSPDGENFAAALEDGNIQIWDARTGQQVGQTLEGHEWSVASVAYSPDGAFIASGSWDETVRIWNAHTYKQIGGPLRGHTEAINSISFSPDSAYIVSGSDDQIVIIWDAKLGKQDGQPLLGHTDVVRSVSYSPDGKQIVTGSYDKTVRLWDAHTREQIGHPFKGHTGEVDSVAFSPNGAYIVSGSQDQTIRVWDARTGKEACQPLHGHPGSIDSVAYSPDGAYIVSGSGDRNVCVWDAQTMNRVGQPLEGHTHWVNTVAYSPNGTYIMSSSYDGTVHIWSALRCQQACRLIEGHSRWVNSVSFSPNSAHVASGSDDGTVCIWDSTTGMLAGRPLEGHTDLVHSVSYSPDGTHIASGSQDKTICIWNVGSGQQIADPLRGHTDAVKCISFSPDGTRIASGSCDGTVIIWDAKLGKQEGQPLQGYTGPVNSVSYSPIGERIVTGSDDGTVRVWDISTREQIGKPFEHESSVCSVAHSPDGASIVSGSDDAAICTWDANTGDQTGQWFHNYPGLLGSVKYSPNGHYIASSSTSSSSHYDVCIWDAHTGQQVCQPLRGHTKHVTSVTWSSDNKYLASGSFDTTVRIWDLSSHVMGGSFTTKTNKATSINCTLTSEQVHRQSEHSDTHACASACELKDSHSRWLLDEEGWVVLPSGELLLWVPPDLRTTLVYPHNPAIASSRHGALYLRFDLDKIGSKWAEHFNPFRFRLSS
ncbi:WD repeat-containing protein [Ceratobasidium sp. AG-Ba]|nr:WD repeat-containing protein [Ceratobasidium sp. AG-Ba]QRW04414.1 WD repeat-containing protein [Ceratobasidium sp. AG-Ba]